MLQLPLSDERRSVITEVREVLAEVQEALMSYVAEQWRTDHLQPMPDKLAETVDKWPMPSGPSGNLEFFVDRMMQPEALRGVAV